MLQFATSFAEQAQLYSESDARDTDDFVETLIANNIVGIVIFVFSKKKDQERVLL